jgi:hypothetical protein
MRQKTGVAPRRPGTASRCFIVPGHLLMDLVIHLETHVGSRQPFNRKVSLLIDALVDVLEKGGSR